MLLGNLCAEPELRFTQGGQAVLHLRLATSERYKDREGAWKDRTEYHAVVLWGKRGEALAKILNKGSSLFVEGSNRTSSYDDRDGNKRYKTEVVAQNVILSGRPQRGENPDAEPPRRRETTPQEAPEDVGGFGNDDIPF